MRMRPLAEMPGIYPDADEIFENPLMGVLVGTVFTALIQSSAASRCYFAGVVDDRRHQLWRGEYPIIMGQNIGTCITALISSIGGSREAKKVAVIHISYNVIGTILCLALFYGCHAIFDFTFVDNSIDSLGIAACHSIFNIVTTLMLFPFGKQLEKLASLLIGTKRARSPARCCWTSVCCVRRPLRCRSART